MPLKSSKNCSILFNKWHHRISHEKLSARANVKLLCVIISAIGVQKRVKVCGLSWISLQLLGDLLLEKWTIFDPFWPLGCPKKGQNLWFVLNKWQYKICVQKLYLSANFQFLGVIFRGWVIFDNFAPPPLTPRVPQNVSKYVV